jgi:hypothetical protein
MLKVVVKFSNSKYNGKALLSTTLKPTITTGYCVWKTYHFCFAKGSIANT